jgi:hypothetical protein
MGQNAAGLIGCSLWRYATEAIQAAETALHDLGWWQDPLPAPVEVHTGARQHGASEQSGADLVGTALPWRWDASAAPRNLGVRLTTARILYALTGCTQLA